MQAISFLFKAVLSLNSKGIGWVAKFYTESAFEHHVYLYKMIVFVSSLQDLISELSNAFLLCDVY